MRYHMEITRYIPALRACPGRPRMSSAERSFQILECMVDLGEPATSYQIAKRLDAPISTVHVHEQARHG